MTVYDPNNTPTILWHDYETWGATPKKDHPAQFAAIRTDYDLNPIGDPINIYCAAPADYLPHPQACLITGITPQLALEKGTNQHQFMKKVLAHMSLPNTCSAGYNTIRFDDEVTRYSAYRNYFEPYSREWANGNSRWDIIDLVRTCYALRPEGIEWPLREDGAPSFRLELLSQVNNLAHENAHDALSDVWATIAMAKLIKEKQPKLYNYFFELRDKNKARDLVDIDNKTPLMHVSSKLNAFQGCCTWIVPIAWHPSNKNALIVIDLQQDPSMLASLDVESLKERLYTPNSELKEGESRPPIKLVHLNKCPILATAKTLKAENAERLGIDRQACLKHLEFIKNTPEIVGKLIQLYEGAEFKAEQDSDYMLYDGFFNKADTQLIQHLQTLSIEQLAHNEPSFIDKRLQQQWFKFKARNYPQYLSEQETQKWRQHCNERLTDDSGYYGLSVNGLMSELENLCSEHENNTNKINILKAIYEYVSQL